MDIEYCKYDSKMEEARLLIEALEDAERRSCARLEKALFKLKEKYGIYEFELTEKKRIMILKEFSIIFSKKLMTPTINPSFYGCTDEKDSIRICTFPEWRS